MTLRVTLELMRRQMADERDWRQAHQLAPAAIEDRTENQRRHRWHLSAQRSKRIGKTAPRGG